MKIPAVAIATAFTGGILLGLHARISRGVSWNAGALGLLLCSNDLTWRNFLYQELLGSCDTGSLIAWVEPGQMAGCLAQSPLPVDHVLNRMARGEINAKSPLRRHGRVSNEPARLPWGYSFDIALSGVDVAGEFLPCAGRKALGIYAEGRRSATK